MGWEVHPEGLHRAITAAARSGLPVYVTENGIATADDAQRIAYIRAHLAQAARAIAEGVDLRGFFYWSSFDNFEWAEGYRPTFGLIGIDRDDGLRRVVRPSANAYRAIATSGSLNDSTSATGG
jgi:beta-glucosidase